MHAILELWTQHNSERDTQIYFSQDTLLFASDAEVDEHFCYS